MSGKPTTTSAKASGLQGSDCREPRRLPVTLAVGLAVDLDRLSFGVGHPVLGNSGLRVERRLSPTVIRERRLCDLDDEQDVLGRGMGFAVVSAAKDGQVRLGHRIGEKLDRALHPDPRARAQRRHEQIGEPVDEGGVASADRRHRQDLAADELDTLVLAQDADLGHPHVLVSREQAARALHLDFHGHPPAPVYDRRLPRDLRAVMDSRPDMCAEVPRKIQSARPTAFGRARVVNPSEASSSGRADERGHHDGGPPGAPRDSP